MIFENSQDIITFELPKEYTNIGIKLSGGADSAIVLYMLCKYLKETNRRCEIIPMTVCHAGKAFQLQFATKVIFFMQDTFGTKFGKHYTGVNYHSESQGLGIAIDYIEDGDKKGAVYYMGMFNDACKDTLED